MVGPTRHREDSPDVYYEFLVQKLVKHSLIRLCLFVLKFSEICSRFVRNCMYLP
jgi:hypothetical protein